MDFCWRGKPLTLLKCLEWGELFFDSIFSDTIPFFFLIPISESLNEPLLKMIGRMCIFQLRKCLPLESLRQRDPNSFVSCLLSSLLDIIFFYKFANWVFLLNVGPIVPGFKCLKIDIVKEWIENKMSRHFKTSRELIKVKFNCGDCWQRATLPFLNVYPYLSLPF